jgi:hypothetical protein
MNEKKIKMWLYFLFNFNSQFLITDFIYKYYNLSLLNKNHFIKDKFTQIINSNIKINYYFFLFLTISQ